MALKCKRKADAKIVVWPPHESDRLFRGKDPSLWSFWEHGVTSSFLGSFTTCLEQTRLTFVEGWRSRYVPEAFEFGTAFHWMLEQTYAAMNEMAYRFELDDLTALAKTLTKRYEKVWIKGVENPTQKQLDLLDLCLGKAEQIYPGYMIRWQGDFNGGKYPFRNTTRTPKEWVDLERVFCIPYTFPDGKKTVLRGRRDGVFKDVGGRLWVFDTKCRSVINHEDALDTLPLDLQQMLYLWVTWQEYNVAPAGTVMNIIRRPGQRWLQTDTKQSLLERIRVEVQKPKNFDYYYVRYEMRLGKNEIQDWKVKVLDPLMQSVRMWWEGSLPHYLNGNALISKYGRCQMFLPIVKQDYTQCYKAEYPFGELAEVA